MCVCVCEELQFGRHVSLVIYSLVVVVVVAGYIALLGVPVPTAPPLPFSPPSCVTPSLLLMLTLISLWKPQNICH